MRRSQVTLVAGAGLCFFLAASIGTLLQLDRLRSHATLEEVLYISSPRALKRMSLGYDGFLADIYWTRAVQYFGGRHAQGAESYNLLAPLLDITTTLDPQLLVAYEFGSSFLTAKPPNGAGQPDKAIELVKKGIAQNPDQWKLPYDLGFIYYMDLKDYKSAAAAFARAADLPEAHPFTRVLAATTAQRGNDPRTAYALWQMTYQNTTSKDIRANAATHLRALQVDQEVTNLQEVVNRYGQQSRRLPGTFAEIARAGLLPGVPLDPLGHPYRINSIGDVEVESPDDLPFIQKGLPPGYVPPAKPKLLPAD